MTIREILDGGLSRIFPRLRAYVPKKFQKASFIGAAGMLLLSSCSTGGTTITQDDWAPFYSSHVVQSVVSDGEFPTTLINNPFGKSHDDELRALLEMPGAYPATIFVPATLKHSGRLVMMFDPKGYPDGRAACAYPERYGEGPRTGEIRVLIAFCMSDEMTSELFLSAPRPASVSDPALRRALSVALQVLFKPMYGRGGDCAPTASLSC